MITTQVLDSLGSLLDQIGASISALCDRYDTEEYEIPEFDDLKDNKVFYDSYRNHVALAQLLTRELTHLSSINVELKRVRLDDVDGAFAGYGMSTLKKMKSDLSHYTKILEALKEQVSYLKHDVDMRLKFLSNTQYLLTSPYNSASMY